jgi:eukaryotic-like serine/threonine-protein kinase
MSAKEVGPDARVGTAFAGRYRIIRLLGQGDRKRTYLAQDAVLNRRVALALIKPAAARSDPSGTRREVEMLGQAGDHGNIVTLHDQGTAEDTDYFEGYSAGRVEVQGDYG